nr:uncharacterized protein LOC123765577 [Procambarus clarkii]
MGQCGSQGRNLPDTAKASSCPPEQEFCLQLGICVSKGQCDSQGRSLPPAAEASSCPPGQEFCLQLGICVIKGQCGSQGTNLPDTAKASSCPPEQEFCLQLGICVSKGQCGSQGTNLPNTAEASSCSLEQEFCLRLGTCVSKGQCGSQEANLPNTAEASSCSLEQEFCLRLGTCVSKGQCGSQGRNLPDTAKASSCPPEQEFCLQLASVSVRVNVALKEQISPILPKLHPVHLSKSSVFGLALVLVRVNVALKDLPDTAKASSCPPEQEFCLQLGTCVSKGQCCSRGTNLPNPAEASSCSLEQEFCLQLGICVSKGQCGSQGRNLPAAAEASSCPLEHEFCLRLGTCVSKGQCGSQGRNLPDTAEASSCPPEQEFCLRLGTCVSKGRCGSRAINLPNTAEASSCPPGLEFCLRLGSCIIKGQCEPSGIHRASTKFIRCPPQQEFCLQLGTCVSRGDCSGLDQRPRVTGVNCRRGQLFCLVTGTCEPAGSCGKGGNPGDGTTTTASLGEVCPPDKVFCLSSGTCEAAGGCGDRPPGSMATMCPRGYIYCLQKRECVSASKGCADPSPTKAKSCRAGTVFSVTTGACIPDPTYGTDTSDWMPELKCPGNTEKASTREPFTYSTCISNRHCPLNYSCCPDPETLHLQCVDGAGNTDKNTINMTCLVIGKPRHDTGLVCTHPEDCPITSVCCSGRCRSLKGTSTCPPSTMYCPVTRSCLTLGNSCSKVCPPRYIYCVATGECGPENTCEFDQSSGAPWTLPGPLRLPRNYTSDPSGSQILVSELYRNATTNNSDTSEVVFTVQNCTTWFGSWMKRGSPSDVWVHLEPTSMLSTSNYLRYKPYASTYAFGLDFINMTETESQLPRLVVELVAPEIPAIQLTLAALNISLKEDTPRIIRLSELVNLTCEDDRYWQAWEEGADLPKQASKAGLLDYGSPTVVSWVRSLQQPRFNANKMSNISKKGGTWQGSGMSGRSSKYSEGQGNSSFPGEPEGPNAAGSTESGERGLKLEWAAGPNSRKKAKIRIAYSLDGGNVWLTMNPFLGAKLPLSSCDAAKDVLVRLHPPSKGLRSPKLHVSVYTDQDTEHSNETSALFQNEYDIPLEIQEASGAPVARPTPNLRQVPVLTYGLPNTGYPAHVYASAYYIDGDESTKMSILILQAYGSYLGTWQYSLDNGATYKDIVDLEDDPFPKTMGLAKSHQGIVNLEEVMEKTKCDFESMLREPSAFTSMGSDNECMEKVKEKMKMYNSKPASNTTEGGNEDMSSTGTENTAPAGSSQGKRLPRSTTRQGKRGPKSTTGRGKRLPRSTAGQGKSVSGSGQRQFGGFGTGNINVSTTYPSITGLLMPWTALIRFNHTREYWTLVEARQKTRLVFVASDGADLQEAASDVKMINISFSQTGKMRGLSSLARDPVVMSMEWKDCTGQRLVSNPPRVVDSCGVCGGDNTSCLDCNDVLFGSAYKRCDVCVGGNTGKTTKLDCAGQCWERNILKEVGSSIVCVPKSEPNVTLCDGTIKSTANINQCGICVEGETGLKKDAKLDQCGVCFGLNTCVACDGVVNSTARTNICGACLNPSDPKWNNCSGLRVTSDSLDACINDVQDMIVDPEKRTLADLRSLLTVEAEVAGVKAKTHTIDNCSLVSDIGQGTPAVAVSFQNNGVKAVFKILLSGNMSLQCTFKSKYKKQNPSMVQLTTTDTLTVLDSRAVMLETDKSEVDTTNSSVVTLAVKYAPSLNSAVCVLIYDIDSSDAGDSNKTKERRLLKGEAPPRLVQELATALVAPGRVACTVPKDARPGQAQIGLVLTFAALILMYRVPLNLPTKPLVIKAPAPEVVSAVLDSTGEVLNINFNVNVDAKAKCSQIINWPWTGPTKSPGPICKFVANQLRVQLGPAINVLANTSLAFNNMSAIRRAYGNAITAPAATGNFTVTQPVVETELTFQLTGDTQACNTSVVKVSITSIRGAKITDVTPVWNITWEPGGQKWSQGDTLQVWQSVHALKGKMKMWASQHGFSLTVPGNGFLPGKDYMVVAHLETSDGRSSDAIGMTITTMPPDQLLQVSISGPTVVRVDSRFKYKAKVSLCSHTDTLADDLKLQYYWSVDGEGTNTGELIGKSITLPAGSLRGGHAYILSVTVIAEDPTVMGTGKIEITTVSQGLEVITSTDSLMLGSVSPIKIDASKSMDKDNLQGALSFRWWCSTQNGGGCYTSSGGTLTRFENTLSDDELTKATLKIPSALLPPDRYNMTVEIRNRESKAEKTVGVEVVAGQCALITTKPTATVVDPQKRIRIPASITGPADLQVQWCSVSEPGLLDVDISQLPVGQIAKLGGESKERDYDLVLPKPKEGGINFPGLVGDASYKFRILVKSPAGYSCFSDLRLKTNSPPEGGIFKVVPTNGKALVTNFTFSASYWTDSPEDLPLAISFGYRLESAEGFPIAWPFITTDNDPSKTLLLPAGSNQSKVIPLVKICDIHGACTIREGKVLTLTLASEIPKELLSTLIRNFKERMSDDDLTKSGLDTITVQLATLTAMNLGSEAAVLTQRVEDVIREKLSTLSARMDNDVASIVRSLNILKGLKNMLKQFPVSQDIYYKIKNFGRLLSAALLGDPVQDVIPDLPVDTSEEGEEEDDDAVHYPSSDDDLDAVRNKDSSSSRELHSQGNRQRRVKRSSPPANGTQQLRSISLDGVVTVLETFEQGIVAAAASRDTTADMAELLGNLPKYSSGLCLGMSSQDEPSSVLGTFVAMTVVRFSQDQSDTMFTIANSKGRKDDFVDDDSFVIWGDILLEYKEWSCGKKGDEGNAIPCYGACLATMLLKSDYLSPITGAEEPGNLTTPVAKTILINPATGVEIQVNMTKDKIAYHLVVLNDTIIPAGYQLKCFGWDGDEWNGTLCLTGKVVTRGSVKRLRCLCKSPVYVAGFVSEVSASATTMTSTMLETTTILPTEAPPFIPESVQYAQIVIDENFHEVVGEKEDEFKQLVASQIASQLNISETRIHNMTIRNGSIIVGFDVLPDLTRTSDKTPQKVVDELYELINSGGLVILGPTNKQLNIPPQSINGPLVQAQKDPTKLPIIIGAIVGGIVMIVIVFICIAIYLKNKKRMDKVEPLQMADSKHPTYSSIHFEQSLDGTVASLAKYRNAANTSNRSLSAGGAYSDEGIYIERRSTANSSRAGSGGSSSGKGSYDSGTGQDVPEPFRYRVPTKEQLERSGPIPEHIIREMKKQREVLPGTPENMS